RLTLQGSLAGDTSWTKEIQGPPVSPGSRALETTLPLGALFGREAAADCEMEMAAGPSGDAAGQFQEQIEALGLRHKIPTSRTSLVAVADEPSVDPRKSRRRRRLPVEFPAAVSAEGTGYAVEWLFSGGVEASHDMVREPAPFMVEPCIYPGPGKTKKLSPLESVEPPMTDRDAPHRTSRPLNLKDPSATVLQARMIRVRGDLLVVELEAPVDGFLLPAPPATVQAAGEGFEAEAAVDEALSTRPGPHEKGLTLRLALRLEAAKNWPSGELSLCWEMNPPDQRLLAMDMPETSSVVLKVVIR
ncbi:MAG: hypothetical protein ACE5ID_12215, partial [Acidobacteriota bacterium]